MNRLTETTNTETWGWGMASVVLKYTESEAVYCGLSILVFAKPYEKDSIPTLGTHIFSYYVLLFSWEMFICFVLPIHSSITFPFQRWNGTIKKKYVMQIKTGINLCYMSKVTNYS